MRRIATTELVEKLLMRYQEMRDSDKKLIVGVLQALGAGLSEKQREIIYSVNFESIRRYRQKLQEEGKFLPSPEVAKRRKLKSAMLRDAAGYGDKNLMQELIEKPTPEWAEGIIGKV